MCVWGGGVKPPDSQAVLSLFKRNWGSTEPNTMGATFTSYAGFSRQLNQPSPPHPIYSTAAVGRRGKMRPVPSMRMPGARPMTLDRMGRRGLTLGPSGCRFSRILKMRWLTRPTSPFLSPFKAGQGAEDMVQLAKRVPYQLTDLSSTPRENLESTLESLFEHRDHMFRNITWAAQALKSDLAINRDLVCVHT